MFWKIFKIWKNYKKKKLAKKLFKYGIIKFGAFRLKLHEKNPDAPLSPIYLDLRRLQSLPKVMTKTVKVLKHLIKDLSKNFNLEFDCYAGLPIAATPIVAVLSHKTDIPMITPRQPKSHGTEGSIDGIFEAGQKVLLVDDLITKADTKFEGIRIVEVNDLIIAAIVVLIDREQGGMEELRKSGYNAYAVFGLRWLLQYYLNKDFIEEKRYNEIIDYLANN